MLEGGFRVPCIVRWPGHVPPGRVENGLMSGLDWFPTLVAAAGNPNIVDELLHGKYLGERTYKVHLDGYNQLDFLTGRSPSKRNEIFYFAESTLGAVRIGDYKYRFIDQPGGWLGGTVKVDWPILTNLRLDPFERTNTPALVAELLTLVRLRVLALRVRAAGGGEVRQDLHRVSADAEAGAASTWKRSRRRFRRSYSTTNDCARCARSPARRRGRQLLADLAHRRRRAGDLVAGHRLDAPTELLREELLGAR